MPMNAENLGPEVELTLSDWGADDIASFAATGSDRRAVLEAALRATLALAGATPSASMNARDVRSAPIRGEGDDLALLLVDLVEDLLDQVDYFGAGLQDVTIDGLVRRDDGGVVAWGYASGVPGSGGALAPLTLNGLPTVSEEGTGRIVVRASLVRG